MDLQTFIQLQNDCRVNAGLPPMTPEEEQVDYAEFCREEERRERYLGQ